MTDAETFRPGRMLVGALIALAGHAVTFGVAYVAGLIVQPSVGGGFEDLAAVVLTFLGTQVALGLGCLIAGAVLFSKGRRELGLGLLVGWLVGLAGIVVFGWLTR